MDGRILPSAAAPGAGGWVVVYLEGPAKPAARGPVAAALHSGPAGLAPAALAVAPGQPVEIQIDSDIHHRFFSSSFPNEFRLPRSGAGQRIAFEHPGVVHVYCSLHPDERATIFVAPSRHFAAVQAPGRYSIADVPPGRYSLHAWSGDHTRPVRHVTVTPGKAAFVELTLDGEPSAAEPAP